MKKNSDRARTLVASVSFSTKHRNLRRFFGARCAPAAIAVSAFAVAVAFGTTAQAQGVLSSVTEQFNNTTLRDAAKTSADWGTTSPGNLRFSSVGPKAQATLFPPAVGEQLPGVLPTRALELADLDGDGDLDLVEGTSGTDGVLLNDGNGGFGPRVQLEATIANTREVAVGDVDRDGDLDIVSGRLSDLPRLYRNAGDGVTYVASNVAQAADAPWLRTDYVTLVDLNKDGHLDVVTANQAGFAEVYYLNTGDPAQPFGANGIAGIDVAPPAGDTQVILGGDLDNDGDIDLVSLNWGERSFVHVNLGNNANGRPTFDTDGFGDIDMSDGGALGDLDGDGFLDLVVVNPVLGQQSKVYYNTKVAGAPFDEGTPFTDVTDEMHPRMARLADADDDGDLDLFLTPAGSLPASKRARIYFNNGGAFGIGGYLFIGTDQVMPAAAVGDVDSDGDLDFIAGNETRDDMGNVSGAVNRLFRNAGQSSGDAPRLQLRGVATSLAIDNESTLITGVRLLAAPAALGAHNSADFWVSSNGGVKWLRAIPGGPAVTFPAGSAASDLRWRAFLSSLSSAATVGAAGLAIDSVTIEILGVNNPPAFTSTAPTSATQGVEYLYQVAAVDPDAHPVTFTAPTLPAWLTLTGTGNGTATLRGTPAAANVGNHPVELRAADDKGATATQTFTIAVGAQVNGPPGFTSVPPTGATERVEYVYQITATDPNADPLTIAAPTKPAWLTLVDNGNGTATLRGTPTGVHVGAHNVELSVQDGKGGSASQPILITVVAAAGAPTITLNGTSPMTLQQGATFTDPGATATDAEDGNLTAQITTTGAVNTSTPGSYTVTYRVVDTAGKSAETQRTVVVQAPAPAPQPAPSGGGDGGGGAAGLLELLALVGAALLAARRRIGRNET